VPESLVVLEATLPDEKYDMKAEGTPQCVLQPPFPIRGKKNKKKA
jgi:hypothetical protein